MQGKAAYAVVLDEGSAVGLSLRHMFTVICGLSCDVYSDADRFFEDYEVTPNPDVVILGKFKNSQSAVLHRLLKRDAPFVVVLGFEECGMSAEQAFLTGAHDVIRMPCSLQEIALRLRARIGMKNSPEDEALFLDASNWDEEAYIVGRAGLTDAEAQIAHVLISHSGEIVSRDALSFAIDGRAWDYGDRKFDVHVAKIRKKLTGVFGDHISVQTVRSAGYILSIDVEGYDLLMQTV